MSAGRSPLRPYVPGGVQVRELTPLAIVLGVSLSLVFGMVNAYLALKVGLTVSASIPSAVLSMTVLRILLRRGTILENNTVHTIASSGESLAAGIIFTIPALIFLELQPSSTTIALVGGAAGALGVLMMVPLRRSLTVDEHETLPFPEGTACAQILIAGDKGGTTARPVLLGIGIAAAYQLAMRGLDLWRHTVSFTATHLHKATLGAELSPLFLGVGFLIGPRIATTMLVGGMLGWTILIPVFDAIGGSPLGALFGVPDVTAREPSEIWSNYVRYVGAGAVTAGGLAAIVRALPVMVAAIRRLRTTPGVTSTERTDLDLPPQIVVGGTVLIALGLWGIPAFQLSFLPTVLAIAFTGFFVVVSGRIVGLVGTTAQPVSGMTITALLATSLCLAMLGERGPSGIAASIMVGAVVCIAIALAGDMAQDLKTGALLGATPRNQQIGELIGVAAASLRASAVLFLLHAAYTIGSPELPAPQAQLMATLVTGVMEGQLPWALMFLGAAFALTAEALGAVSLAFAIGLYLPVTTSAPLIFGGLLRAHFTRRPGTEEPSTSLLFASGLVAGDALMGIGLAGLAVAGWTDLLKMRVPGPPGTPVEMIATIVPFGILMLALTYWIRRDRP